MKKIFNHLKRKGGDVRNFINKMKFIVNKSAKRLNNQRNVFNSSDVPFVKWSKNPALDMVYVAVDVVVIP